MGTLTHLGIVAAFTVAGCVAVLATVGWRSPYARNSAPEAAAVTACVVLIVWCAYAISWTLTPAAGFLSLAGVSAISRRHVATTLPRKAVAHDLVAALSKQIGADWDKRVRIDYAPGTNTAVELVTTVPAATLPSSVIPNICYVCSEDLGGFWNALSSGRTITVSRQDDDPAAIQHLKEVVYAQKAFTTSADITDHTTANGDVSGFTVVYGTNIAPDIALGPRRLSIEKQIRQSLTGPGIWTFDWRPADKTCVATRTMFAASIDDEIEALMWDSARRYELCIGQTPDGQWLQLPLNHVAAFVVGGKTGSGKTGSLRSILAPLIGCEAVQFAVVNGKANGDWRPFEQRAFVHLKVGAADDDLVRAKELMESLDAELNRRMNALDDADFWDTGPTVDMPLLVVVIDECQKLLDLTYNPEATALVRRIRSYIRRLTATGRAAGFLTVLSTQKPTAESIPTEIRDNAELRACYSVMNREAADATLADGWHDAGLSPVKEPNKGLCVCYSDANGFQRVQSPYIHRARITESAGRYAHLRRDPRMFAAAGCNAAQRASEPVTVKAPETPRMGLSASSGPAVTPAVTHPENPAVTSAHNAGGGGVTPGGAVTVPVTADEAVTQGSGVCCGPDCMNLLRPASGGVYCCSACRQRAYRARAAVHHQ